MLCDLRATINNTGQRNHPPLSKPFSVHLAAHERAWCISAPDVPLGCACFAGYHTSVHMFITPNMNSVCHEKSDPGCHRPAVATRNM